MWKEYSKLPAYRMRMDGKIIFQIFQLFLHGDIFVLIRERILKKTAERLDSVTDDLVIVHGCHKAQTV